MAQVSIPKPPLGATHYKVDKDYRIHYYKKDRSNYGDMYSNDVRWAKYFSSTAQWCYGYFLIEPPIPIIPIQISLTEKIIDAW